MALHTTDDWSTNALTDDNAHKKEQKQDPTESWPRQTEAEEYLQEHKIIELFNNITSQLIFHRPENPKIFMIDILEQLLKSRSTHMNIPCLFDASNILSVFRMLDPTQRGFVTLKQYLEAMKTMGVEDYSKTPPGFADDRITVEVFMSEAKKGLAKAYATYKGASVVSL